MAYAYKTFLRKDNWEYDWMIDRANSRQSSISRQHRKTHQHEYLMWVDEKTNKVVETTPEYEALPQRVKDLIAEYIGQEYKKEVAK